MEGLSICLLQLSPMVLSQRLVAGMRACSTYIDLVSCHLVQYRQWRITSRPWPPSRPPLTIWLESSQCPNAQTRCELFFGRTSAVTWAQQLEALLDASWVNAPCGIWQHYAETAGTRAACNALRGVFSNPQRVTLWTVWGLVVRPQLDPLFPLRCSKQPEWWVSLSECLHLVGIARSFTSNS